MARADRRREKKMKETNQFGIKSMGWAGGCGGRVGKCGSWGNLVEESDLGIPITVFNSYDWENMEVSDKRHYAVSGNIQGTGITIDEAKMDLMGKIKECIDKVSSGDFETDDGRRFLFYRK